MNALVKPFPLDDQICFSLYSASMAVGRVYKPLLDRLGLTYPQFLVLLALSECSEMTVGAVARRLSLEASTVTPPLKRLYARGVVRKRRNAANERQVLVSLTDEGRNLYRESACLGATLLDASGHSPQTLAGLNAEIRALRDALDVSRETRAPSGQS
jgi:DNA-binding MarR family transcriptional regulator